MDEIASWKGHGQYKLVISAPELGIVLDLLRDRRKESLEAWFDQRGVAWCAQVEVCCADMWDAYHTAAATKLPNAAQVVDRFHVMKNLTDALSKARRTLQKQASDSVKEQLKGSRWLLLKNRATLADEEQQQLALVLDASPELKTCYELKEEFRHWFNQPQTRAEADQSLTAWIAKTQATGLKSLLAFTNTLHNWREHILNYFDGRHSNGFAEGVNLKIKLVHRRAFGYRNFEFFRLHILVAFDPKPAQDTNKSR